MNVENKGTPRYLRINLLKTNIMSTLQYLKTFGYYHKKSDNIKSVNGFNKTVDKLKHSDYIFDYHIPALLVFSPSAELNKLKWVEEGQLILQDKASCLVAPLLAPHPNSFVLDMCAAPGYKTLHLASYLQQTGKIFAVDICAERIDALKNMVDKMLLKNILCLQQDALEKLRLPQNEIQYILIDPPCTVPGKVENKDPELHNLRSSLLKKALNDFPSVRRVVYSTCSSLEEENEQVIEQFFPPPNGFELVNLSYFYKGMSCGLKKYKSGDRCLRLSPEVEKTNGFFIAMFERSVPYIFETRKNAPTEMSAKEKVESPQKEDRKRKTSETDHETEVQGKQKKKQKTEVLPKKGKRQPEEKGKNNSTVLDEKEENSNSDEESYLKVNSTENETNLEEMNETESSKESNNSDDEEGAVNGLNLSPQKNTKQEEDADNDEEESDEDDDDDNDDEDEDSDIDNNEEKNEFKKGDGNITKHSYNQRTFYRGGGGRQNDFNSRDKSGFHGSRGKGEFRGRGRGRDRDFRGGRGRGRGDFRGGRGRGDFRGGRGRGNFQGQGRRDFRGRGRRDFNRQESRS